MDFVLIRIRRVVFQQIRSRADWKLPRPHRTAAAIDSMRNRPNIVDPLTRENTNINVGDYIPPIDIELIDEDYLEITILPKGFGSENNNALKMALPAEGIEGIKEFVD